MKLKPIKSEAEYENALSRLELIFDAEIGSEDSDELEILTMLIEKYEKQHFPIGFPTPIEAIKFRMEQLGMTQNELAEIIGQKSRASEILNKKRKLSLEMIRKLTEKLNIPSEVLIQTY
ncbi:helix-turn-helix domain-containing protein [Paenimyroides tangerinum]|uniref:Helix-turn-helix domain-containing protein n=1 Tax=Paenimyroides tangerinum TaxID=2488728 RepID=A0A3P3W7Q4_9FLAO|nr:helix-turn-helix domain-containing protein [Paenimyroides tangerinum]RRJ91000.1 helix-turn-helix domain-containing protein [Paenimyroides tangerinum]